MVFLIGRCPLLTCDGFVPVRSKQPMDHKRIFLFTNDDNPLRGDEDEQKKVNIVAKVPPASPHSSSCSIPHSNYFGTQEYRSDQMNDETCDIYHMCSGSAQQ